MVHPLHKEASMQWYLPLMTVCNLIQTVQQVCGDIPGCRPGVRRQASRYFGD